MLYNIILFLHFIGLALGLGTGFATATLGARVPTIYTRIGDALGWLCVAGMIVLIPLSIRRRARR